MTSVFVAKKPSKSELKLFGRHFIVWIKDDSHMIAIAETNEDQLSVTQRRQRPVCFQGMPQTHLPNGLDLSRASPKDRRLRVATATPVDSSSSMNGSSLIDESVDILDDSKAE